VELLRKFCCYCGRQLETDAQFCDKCGKRSPPLEVSSGPTPSVQDASASQPASASFILESTESVSSSQTPKPAAPTSTKATPATRASPPSYYVDIPITRHRVVFSYLSSPTALIAVVVALLVLVGSSLPLATIDVQVCALWCTDRGTIEVTLASLVYSFPLFAVVLVGATFTLIVPTVSLLARSFARVVRSLCYMLFGAFAIIAVVSYGLFYAQYTPMPSPYTEIITFTYHASAITVHYPFYLILVAESILIIVGVLEWLRRPALLFRAYTAPPPKPPKPKRMPVPEVAAPTVSQPLPPEVVEPEVSVQPPAPVGRPLGVTLLVAYYIISAIGAIVSLSFTAWIMGSFSELATMGIATPEVGSLWAAEGLGLVVPAIVAYGLLKGKSWAHTAVRLLSLLAIVGALLGVGISLVVVLPVLSLAGAYGAVMSGIVSMVYAVIAFSFLLGVLLPAAIYWYMSRPHVKAYFARRE